MALNHNNSMKKLNFFHRIPFKWKLLFPIIVALLIVFAYPLIYSFYISFRNIEMIKPSQNDFIGLLQYTKMLKESLFWISVKNTLLFLIIAVSLEFILGFMLALALKEQRRFSNVTRSILLTPIFVTPVAVGLMFRFLLNNQLGLIPKILGIFGLNINFFDKGMALFSIALIDVWQWTPFIMLMLLAGLESLPKEPYEAAQVEGATSLQMLFKITIPMLKPVILIAILIRSLDALKVFEYVYVITAGGPGTATETLQYYIYKVGFGFYRISEAASAAWLLVVMVLLFIVFIYYGPKIKSKGGADQ